MTLWIGFLYLLSESLAPSGARRAIGTEPLAWSRNLSLSRSLAAWLSVSGSFRSSFVSYSTVPAKITTESATTTQTTRMSTE